MDQAVAEWLVSPVAAPLLERAMREMNPESLAVASRWRRQLEAERAAALLDLVVLRRRAEAKLGKWADGLFLTTAGLEMATRRDVARWRADRLVAAGVTKVVDASLGLGIDAIAMVEAGLAVTAYERDPVLATLGRANLRWAHRLAAGPAPEPVVITGEVTELAALVSSDQALFVDPARRGAAGRSWDIAQLSPSWAEISRAIQEVAGPVVVKLGPGMEHHYLPPSAAASWVSHRGDLVELSLWRPGNQASAGDQYWVAGERAAILLPAREKLSAGQPLPPAGDLGAYLYEPDPAVIRAGAGGSLAALLGAHPLVPRIAYLSAESHSATQFAQCFRVLERLPYDTKAVRAWVRRQQIGRLEIKTRGLDLDPARWRRSLQLDGPGAATVICTPTASGAAVLVVERL